MGRSRAEHRSQNVSGVCFPGSTALCVHGGKDSRIVRIAGERAAGAVGDSAAMRLAHGHGERMELVEETAAIGSAIGSECLSCERNQGFVAFAPRSRFQQPMAQGDAAQVLVCHRHGVIESVKQDGIGRLRPYAGKREQTAVQVGGWSGCENNRATPRTLCRAGPQRPSAPGLCAWQSRSGESASADHRERSCGALRWSVRRLREGLPASARQPSRRCSG